MSRPVVEPAFHPELLGDSVLTVALVSCGKMKAECTDLPACELYKGLPFRLAYKHAVETADDVHILSALHGLVPPHRRLAPYDWSLMMMAPSQHIVWGRKILDDLLVAYPMRRLNIVFYAGELYIRPIMRAIHDEDRYWTFDNPLRGMDLFQRIRWFKLQEAMRADQAGQS